MLEKLQAKLAESDSQLNASTVLSEALVLNTEFEKFKMVAQTPQDYIKLDGVSPFADLIVLRSCQSQHDPPGPWSV